jgi:hypothetical protein
MPRNASGTYSLPSGNPVSSGTLIDANWANNTLNDLANEVTDSLSRSAEGGMLAPLRLTDGVQATPSLAFTNEPSTGLYRAGTNDAWFVSGGNQVMQFTSSGVVGRLAAGAVGTPSLTFFGDLNTGVWSPAADTLAASTGGSERLRVDSSGNVGIGGLLATTPSLNKGIYLQSDTNNAVIGYSLYVNDGVNGRRGSMFLDDSSGLWGWDVTASSGLPSYVWRVATSEVMRLTDAGNLGIGTASPVARLDVTGNARILNSGADSQVIVTAPTDSFAPFVRWGVSGIRDSGILGFPAGDDALVYRSGANSFSTGTERFRITAAGNVVAGGSVALATTATNGFLYVPTCAGVPTGTPTAITGMVPIVVDTTNNRWYFYSGGAWRNAGP